MVLYENTVFHQDIGSLVRGSAVETAKSMSANFLEAKSASVVALALIALLLRAPLFGDPVIHSDEQFYIFVGDRLLHGALPYVDLWDRKPIGLFLLYAAMRRLGGDGIVEYQLVATVSATFTAFFIYNVARFLTTARNAFLAGVAYLIYLLMFDGAGGQSPVFYNLLVIAAVRLCVSSKSGSAASGSEAARHLLVSGVLVTLLFGLAMQIKYTAVFEGSYFGILLWQRAARVFGSRRRVVGALGLWAACGLAPTAAAMIAYYHLGYLPDFIQANFLSVFNRHETKLPALLRLLLTAVALVPLVGCAVRAMAKRDAATPGEHLRPMLFGWALVAIGGYLLFGSYYDHYALPLLLPLCVLAAPGFGTSHRLFNEHLVLVFGLVVGVFVAGWRYSDHGSSRQFAHLQKLVQSNLHGCLFIFEGPSILYKQTNACLVTRYNFPSHLNNKKEADALGVDATAEMGRILRSSPSVIVMNDEPSQVTNFPTRNLVQQAVSQRYRLAGQATLGASHLLVYARR